MTMIEDLDKMKPEGSKEDSEQQNSIENASDGRSFQNIPAILPYEAKQALLKEIRHRDNRNLLKPLKESGSAIEESTEFKTKKSSHDQEERQNKGNFLYNIRYGNLPVMEFKLPDGTSGSVDKVPRR